MYVLPSVRLYILMYVHKYIHRYVHPSPFVLVLSYTADVPRTPYMFTDSGPPKRLLVGGLFRGAPNPPMGGLKFYFLGAVIDGPF